MHTANVSLASTTTPNCSAIVLSSDSKKGAQDGIKLAQAWLRSNGGKYKLVSFTSSPSQYSNLVIYYTARIVFSVAA